MVQRWRGRVAGPIDWRGLTTAVDEDEISATQLRRLIVVPGYERPPEQNPCEGARLGPELPPKPHAMELLDLAGAWVDATLQ